jgi:hypothetical protein
VSIELRELLPSDKHQTQKAAALVKLGYPDVAPVLAEMLVWMQDMNWPVARVFQPFLVSIGFPLAPYVRNVLCGDDDVWKYWILNSLVRESAALACELKPELEQLAKYPSVGEQREGVSEAAQEILELPAEG